MDDLTRPHSITPTLSRDPEGASILFICTGNICRSPLAESVFQSQISDRCDVTARSAALRPHHVGKGADPRAIAVATARGYSLDTHVARLLAAPDWTQHDVIMGMGQWHLERLAEIRPENATARLESLALYTDNVDTEIPDPFHGTGADFDRVLDMIETAVRRLRTQYPDQTSIHWNHQYD